jgi:hypothetical protein
MRSIRISFLDAGNRPGEGARGIFDHLVGAGQECRRNDKAELPSCFQVDRQFKARGDDFSPGGADLTFVTVSPPYLVRTSNPKLH